MHRTYHGKAGLRDFLHARYSSRANIWTCKSGTKRKKSGSRYQKLISHVHTAHADYFKTLNTGESPSQAQLDQYFTTSKCQKFFGWRDLIINSLLPFSYVERPFLRRHINQKTISTYTLVSYMLRLTELVENKIAKLLPKHIALVLDGWSQDNTHYFALFALFSSLSSKGYETRLLALSQIGGECSLRANKHHEFLTFVIELYSLNWANVACLTSDNVSTNKEFSNITYLPLIGCSSHLFNLAVQDILDTE